MGYEFDIPINDSAAQNSQVGEASNNLSTQGVLLAYGESGKQVQKDNSGYKAGQFKLDPTGEVDKPKEKPPLKVGIEQNEANIDWDAWTNRALRQAMASLKAAIHQYDSDSDQKFEQGIGATVNMEVNSAGQVDAELTESSGDKIYDELVLKTLRKLTGNPAVRFPIGTHRSSMALNDYRFLTGDHTSTPNFHDGDEETVDM